MKNYMFRFKGLLAINVIAIIVSAIMSISIAYIVKIIVEVGTDKDIKGLKTVIFISILFLLALALSAFIRRFLHAKLIEKILTAIKSDIFQKIMSMNIKTFNEENSATYISSLTNDIKILEDDYFDNILQSAYQIASFIIATIFLTVLSPIMTAVVFVTGILPASIPIIFEKRLSSMKKGFSDNISIFTVKVKDMLTGFEVIKSFNIVNKIKADYSDINNKVERSKFKFNIFNSFVNVTSELFGGFLFIGIMLLGIYFVIIDRMSLGSMLAVTQLMNNVLNPLMVLSEKLSKFKSVKSIEDKINSIIHLKDQGDEGVEKLEFNNTITFNDVKFSYNDERKILKGTNLNIEKGNKYAVVGVSGSGKSTLLKLLLRYYEDYEGSIEIDDMEIRGISVNSLYKLVSVIHQDVFMFDDSIENNISLYEEYSKAEISKVIQQAGLEDLVNSLKDGANSSVGENGCNLSGGEQQRIAIARALIKKTPILVLDEATSSLDNETAYNIEKSILEIDDLTCFVITHKLNKDILRKYDEITVLKEGEVVENGKFDELISKREYFYSLYNVMPNDEIQRSEVV